MKIQRSYLQISISLIIGLIIGSFGFGSASAEESPAPTQQGQVLNICVDKKTSTLRAVKRCKATERAVLLGGTGPQGKIGATGSPGATGATPVSTINAASTFTSVYLNANPSYYQAVMPVRASLFTSKNSWQHLKVKMRLSGATIGGTINCQIMPMESFSGAQTSGTSIGTYFYLVPTLGLQSIEFSDSFIYPGGDYVLACKTPMALLVNASVQVSVGVPISYGSG